MKGNLFEVKVIISASFSKKHSKDYVFLQSSYPMIFKPTLVLALHFAKNSTHVQVWIIVINMTPYSTPPNLNDALGSMHENIKENVE